MAASARHFIATPIRSGSREAYSQASDELKDRLKIMGLGVNFQMFPYRPWWRDRAKTVIF